MLAVILLCISIHSCYIGSKVVVSLLAIHLGASPTTIGLIAGLYGVAPLILGVHSGRLSDRAGVRLPDIAVPLATQAGWNYRDQSIGAPDRLAGEIGSYIPFPQTRADRERTHDARPSIEERYRNRDEYVGKFAAATLDLVERRYLLADDVADLLKHAVEHYDFAVHNRK